MESTKIGSELVAVKDENNITLADVRKYFCEFAEEKEVAMFLNIARLWQLNPFKREIYLVKYKQGDPAKIVVGYESYLKRAESSHNYGGFKVWTEGSIPDMKACIEVYRKDWEKPLYHEVEFVEYCQYKTEWGADKKPVKVANKFWKEKPKTMLKKVAIAQAFRFAFPEQVGGMPYTPDEIDSEVVEKLSGKPAVEIPTEIIKEEEKKKDPIPEETKKEDLKKESVKKEEKKDQKKEEKKEPSSGQSSMAVTIAKCLMHKYKGQSETISNFILEKYAKNTYDEIDLQDQMVILGNLNKGITKW